MTGRDSVLERTEHRPWPLPERRWKGYMRWTDLAFMHWPVPAAELERLVPHPLQLDLYEGQSWLGVVPFRMERTRARWLPRVPTATTFPEVNVRIYVRAGTRTGVWFLSLDAGSRLAVLGARLLLNLPYFHAAMEIATERERVRYRSSRTHGAGAADLEVSYGATGPVRRTAPGTLEHWLTERYCLFGRTRGGAVYYLDIHHLPWPLQDGAAVTTHNSLAAAAGITLPANAPLVHVAKSLDVLAWAPRPLSAAP